MWWCAVALAATGSVEDLEWSSPAQPVPVHDEAPIFTGPLVDTGWWPSSSDPLAVRFHITPTGTVFTDIDADSELAWPDPLWHRVVPIPETGEVEAEASLDIEAELQIDIFGLYTGVVDLWSQSFEMDGGAQFDGMLLDGDPVREVPVDIQGASRTAIEYSIQLFIGLDIVALIDVAPEIDLTLSDGQLVSDIGGTAIVQDVRERWTAVPLDPNLPSSMDTLVTWSAAMDGALHVEFVPTIELDTFIGDFELLSIPLYVTVVDVAGRQEADPMQVMHPLPGLDTMASRYDFGEVLLGQERTLQMPVSNLGDLLLEGDVFIDGDGAFTVFPDELVARSQESDGLSITFTPGGTTLERADLVIRSNDPLQPEVRVPLTGLGFVEQGADPTTDPTGTDTVPTGDTTDGGDRVGGGGDDTEAKGGCGCAGTGPSAAPFAALLLGVLGLRRRR